MDSLPFKRPTASTLSSTEFDVVVIGGGITGAGVAQDAASRGLKVVLVERSDFASGTSSKSTKLIHGGLRYLANLQVLVTLESVRERQLQQKLAPHMVWSLPFVIPTYRGSRLKNLKTGFGLWLYDLMATGMGNSRFHRKASREEVLALCPGVREEGLTGAYVYQDCRTDDARHTLEVIKSACEQGALAFNYARVVGLVRKQGRIVGVDIVDESPRPNGKPAPRTPIRIRGKVVVNATGVWMQQVAELTGVKGMTEVVPAKGIHLTLSPSRLPIKSAMVIPSVHDKRFCFAIPWYDVIVIGTTDSEHNGELDDVQVKEDEIRYLLDAVNAQFPKANIHEQDVLATYAGLRPLIKEAGKTSTADLSRQHHLEESAEGLVSISGGKLTTYRRMAKSTIDLVVKRLKRLDNKRKFGACKTASLPLGGWQRGDDVAGCVRVYQQIGRELGLSEQTACYLPTVYGLNVKDVLALVREDRRNLGQKLCLEHPYIAAQVVYAVRHEAALNLDDVLARRLRLAITDRHAAVAVALKVAALMGDELTWTQEELSAQVVRFLKEWA